MSYALYSKSQYHLELVAVGFYESVNLQNPEEGHSAETSAADVKNFAKLLYNEN